MTGRRRSATLVLLLAATLLSACTDSRAPEPRVAGTGVQAVPVPQPPAGMRWQGVNGVVVAVPRGWSTSTDLCQPAAEAVWMTSDHASPVPCPLVRARGSVLQVGKNDLGPLRHRTLVRGVELRHSGVRCESGGPSGPCTLAFAVPSREASFQIRYLGPHPKSFVRQLMRSVRLLQPGLTTVPVISYGDSMQVAQDRLAGAGLVARAPQADFPHYATGTRPAAGRIVTTGATVRITIGDG